MPIPLAPVLAWAAGQIDRQVRVVAVDGLRAGGGPWRVHFEHGGTVVDAVLRVGDPDRLQQLATEAAALVVADDRTSRLDAGRGHASDGRPQKSLRPGPTGSWSSETTRADK